MEFKDKIILLTGAGGGIGKELIKSFAREGSSLILVDYSKEMVINSLKEIGLGEKDKSIIGIIEADFTKESAAEDVYKTVKSYNKSVDVIINNAGITAFGYYRDMPFEKNEEILKINLLTPMKLVHLFLDEMMANRKGYIVNMCSIAGIVGAKKFVSYSVSKAGLSGFGDALSNELTRYNIKVINAYPYYVNTPILKTCEQFGKKRNTIVPEKMMDNVEDIAKEIISGIKKEKKKIYVGSMAKQLVFMKNHMPWMIKIREKLGV